MVFRAQQQGCVSKQAIRQPTRARQTVLGGGLTNSESTAEKLVPFDMMLARSHKG